MLFVFTMHYLQLHVPSVYPDPSVQVVAGSYLNDDIVTDHRLDDKVHVIDDKLTDQ